MESSRLFYLPYGEVYEPLSSGPDDFRSKFSGAEWDCDTQVYYMGSRYYDPGLGRFLTPDPREQYDSPYVYTNGDPEAYVDPDGNFAVTLTIIVVGAVLGAYSAATVANGGMNPGKWNWRSGKTWGALIGGALIGGLSSSITALASAVQVGLSAQVAAGVLYSTIQSVGLGLIAGKTSAKEIFINIGIGVATGLLMQSASLAKAGFGRFKLALGPIRAAVNKARSAVGFGGAARARPLVEKAAKQKGTFATAVSKATAKVQSTWARWGDTKEMTAVKLTGKIIYAGYKASKVEPDTAKLPTPRNHRDGSGVTRAGHWAHRELLNEQ